MENWKKVKIGDICVVERGGSPRPIEKYITKDESGVNWIKIGDTNDSMFITSTAQKIIPEGMKKSRYVQPGDFLLSNSMSFGRPYILKIDGCIHDGWLVLRDTENVFDKRFLYYYLSAPSTYQKFKSMAVGGVVNNLNSDMVRNVEVPIPNKEIQLQVSDELDKVTGLINKRKQQLEKLDELVKARFVELFGDPYINDKNWTVDTLGNYMTTLTDFSANGSYELLDSNVVMYDEPNYAIMVRTTDLESGDLSSGVKYIDESAYELLSKSKLFGGELIMNKIGSAGKIYIMPYIDRPASLGRNAFMFRFDDRLNMKYLYFLLSSDYGTNEIQQYVRGAVTKTITKDSTRAIKIIVPPIELQNQFAAFVEQTDKSKLEIQKSLEKLELLKKALMQKYFG